MLILPVNLTGKKSQKKVKIAFIGQKGIPAKMGGVERHVEELAVRLAANGHKVFVYVRDNYTDKNLKEYKGVKLIHLPSISSKNLDAITHTLLATVHAIICRYDVVHYQAIGPSSLSFLIRIFKPRTALVATYHCQDYYHQKWSWFARSYLRFGEWVACKFPHRTIAVSNALGSFIRNEFRREAEVIPNGFSIQKANGTDELAKWGLESKGYILTVSRLVRHKGIHFLVEAFKNLEDKNMTGGKKLVIVGDGFYTDDYVISLKQMAEGRKNIIFTGAQTGEPLAQLFTNAYVFVQPSETEGLSITLLEAMGYGKAVIVSDIPENMEAVKDTGISFTTGNENELENKMYFALENADEMEKFGELAKNRVQEKFNWEKITRATERIYQEIIAQKKGLIRRYGKHF